jgi:hypothetical protein
MLRFLLALLMILLAAPACAGSRFGGGLHSGGFHGGGFLTFHRTAVASVFLWRLRLRYSCGSGFVSGGYDYGYGYGNDYGSGGAAYAVRGRAA